MKATEFSRNVQANSFGLFGSFVVKVILDCGQDARRALRALSLINFAELNIIHRSRRHLQQVRDAPAGAASISDRVGASEVIHGLVHRGVSSSELCVAACKLRQTMLTSAQMVSRVRS
jgi:hypothetical protein